MHKKIEEIKKNEGSPKIIKNIFSKEEINKFLTIFGELSSFLI